MKPIALMTCIMLLTSACFAQVAVSSNPAKGDVTTLIEDLRAIGSVVNDSNAFAAELYAKLAADKKGNLFFSPFSIDTALAMTYAGAAGNTADQMAKTLHFSLPPDKLNPAFAELLSILEQQNKNRAEKPAYQLVVANALWGQKGYAFKPDFTQLLLKTYGAGLNDVDFAQTEQARKAINDWVSQQTKDKIKDLIPEGVLSDATRLVLTNAIYFKSNWAEKFEKDVTRDGPFKVSADKSVDVPMMHLTHRFRYMENDELQMLEMPYSRNELSMVILLPKKADGLADIEKNLTAANIGKEAVSVQVTLPKFKITSAFGVGETLKAMGMTDAFDSKKADFSGMTEKEKLFISAVIHKAFVAVDEEGTEAAAATAVVMDAGAPPRQEESKVFKADHPFAFMIRHNATGAILFTGRVANPKAE